MKKRNILLGLVLVLVLLFSMPAGAATTDQAMAGFVQGKEVFAWFNLSGSDYKSLEVQLQMGDNKQNTPDYTAKVAPYAESGLPVHYYILLDRSLTMPPYTEDVQNFVSELLGNTGIDTRATLASFGDAYEVELSAAVDKDAVMKKLQSIEYDQWVTNMYKGIDDALQDICQFSQRNRGELVQLILVTDGVPDSTYEEPTFDQVKLRMERSPEVVFHTYQVGNADDSALEMGNGLHMTGDSGEAAEAILNFTDELYTVVYKPANVPAEGRSDMQFIIKRGQMIENVLSLGYVPVLGHSDAPDLTVSSEPETSSAPESTVESAPESKPESTLPESSLPESSEAPSSLPETSGDGTSSGEEDASSDTESSAEEEAAGWLGFLAGIDDTTWLIIDIVTVVVFVVIIALILLFILLAHARKKRRMAEKMAAFVAAAIPLRLEVLDGRCKRVRKPLAVATELFIGTDMNGGIVWDEPTMAAKNTRLFVQDGVLYIEDLDSPQGTALGGMRIFAPNRLRSGEIISIGMVQFKLYF